MKINKKILFIILLLLNMITIIIIYFSKYNGEYEINILNNITHIIITISLILIIISINIFQKNNYIFVSFLFLITLLLLIPLLKNYYFFNNGDPPTYYGLIKDIGNYNKISDEFFYPNMFLLFNSLFVIFGNDINIKNNYFILSIIIYIIYLIMIYFNINRINNKFKYLGIIMIGSIIYGKYFYPLTPLFLSFILFTFLVLYIQNGNTNKYILLILSISILFSHPFSCLILILYLFFIYKEKQLKQLLIFNICILLFWLSIVYHYINNIVRVISGLLNFGSAEIYQNVNDSSGMALTKYGLFNIIKYLFINYFLFFYVAIALGIIIIFYIKYQKKMKKENRIFIIKLNILISIILTSSLIIIIFNVLINDFNRVIIYCIPLIYLILVKILKSINIHKFNVKYKSVLIILLISLNVLGFLVLYDHPINYGHNRMITKDQLYAGNFIDENIINNENITNNIYKNTYDIERISDINYGVNYRIENEKYENQNYRNYKNEYKSIKDGIIIFHQLDYDIYDKIFTKTKFIDNTTILYFNNNYNKIYNNKETKIYFIRE